MFNAIFREGMIEVDRIMTEDLDIGIELMMEHAGLNLAKISLKYLTDTINRIVIVAGSGNNGGGGIVAARRLHNWGHKVELILVKGKPKRNIPVRQLKRAVSSGVKHKFDMPDVDINTLVIDAFIGYNFSGELSREAQSVIDKMNKGNVISLDIPSGVDSNTGKNIGGIKIIATITLAWPKSGLLISKEVRSSDIYLVDIGVPLWVYQEYHVSGNSPPNSSSLMFIGDVFSLNSYTLIEFINDKWQISD